MPAESSSAEEPAVLPPAPTEAQRLAIEADPGPLLVVAGPGAGKTFCLIERIRHLVAVNGFAPARLCAVTFTNKAAGEIAHRLRSTLGADADQVTGGTLHRLCLDVLRAHPDAVGLRPGFGIADEEYQRALLRQLGVRAVRTKPTLTEFGGHRLRDAGLDPDLATLLASYLRALRKRNLVDFDDILLLTRDLFRERPAIARATAARWDALLVDEFQDISRVQYHILKALAAPHGHIFAVGDDEQSIYSWTGADPGILGRFEQDAGIRHLMLDVNRRCSRQIITAARRLVLRNGTLFTREIRPIRESAHEVLAYAFGNEAAEAEWIIRDLMTDREAADRRWGDYAVLYRKHAIGIDLESRFLHAGVPCGLARGRAIRDDAVIAQVLASFRVLLDPKDPVSLDALADHLVSSALKDRIRARPESKTDFLHAVRLVAARMHRSDVDRKKLLRFVYQAENLGAVGRRASSVHAAAEAILAMGLGKYRNPLEERAQDLTDPALVEGAPALADRLHRVMSGSGRVRFEPMRGLGIALAGLVGAAGLGLEASVLRGEPVGPEDLVLGSDDAEEGGLPVLLFKALQLVQTHGADETIGDCVAFDVETTGRDTATADVIELGAVRLENGRVVDRFRSMVRPGVAIEAAASRVHGYTDADVQDAPPFPEAWERFVEFVGGRLLVAHNGQQFDIPILKRQAAGLPGLEGLVFLDTLPLARSLFRESARLADLAKRFGVEAGRGHHALDDAETLAGVLGALTTERARRGRIAALPSALDWLGLALAVGKTGPMRPQKDVLVDIARPYVLGRYTDCLERYAAELAAQPEAEAPPVEIVIERLGGRRLMERIRATRTASDRYPQSVARLNRLLEGCEGSSLGEGIGMVFERVALSASEGVEVDPDRVQLLTLHATKGLEFHTVYVVGVEDTVMPGAIAVERNLTDEFPEERRLLYVGMSRAMDRLVLTRVDERDGVPGGGSMFLKETGVTVIPPRTGL